MFISLLLNCIDHFDLISNKILGELFLRLRINSDSFQSVSTRHEPSDHVMKRSEEIIRNLFRNWNIYEDNDDIRKLREKDIVNSFLPENRKIENVDEWLVEILNLPRDALRNKTSSKIAYEFFLFQANKGATGDLNQERIDKMNQIFDCVREIERNDWRLLIDRSEHFLKLLLDSQAENFIGYMLQNKTYYLKGFSTGFKAIDSYFHGGPETRI